MILYRNVFLFFPILFFLSCSDKIEEQKNNTNSINYELTDFLFVGMIEDKEGLYKYNFDEKVYKPFWSGKNERVVELSYSKSRQNFFFITANNLGRAGVFPFINNVKLYVLNTEKGNAAFIEEIGSGLQVFTEWIDENNFRIIITSFDKTFANYINRREMLFNIYGKKLEEITDIFDLTKQGYPQPPSENLNFVSPDKKYLIEARDNGTLGIYLLKNGIEKLIIKGNQQIKHIEWGEGILFLSTINIKPNNESLYSIDPETSKLIVYSTEKNEIIKIWEGSGVKNFFVEGNFILFDDGFKEGSRIIIYDLKNKKINNEIKTEGGCGIRNIPVIPDYGA